MSRLEARAVPRWLESLWWDVRLSLRGLLRSPRTTLAAVLALALGIGANAALFSVARATLWRELPVREPERLVVVEQEVPGFKWPVGATAPFLDASRRRSRSFAGLASLSRGRVNVAGPGRAEVVEQAWVSPDFFTVAGVEMATGRTFRQEEVRRKARVAVIAHRLFQERFAGEPARLRQGLVLDGVRHAVVGVAPAGFDLFGQWQVWLPDVFRPPMRRPRLHFLQVLGRLRPGVTLDQADRDLEAVSLSLVKVEPMAYKDRTVRVTPLSSHQTQGIVRSLSVLGICAAFVLLIACADVAGLLLARAVGREREIAVRATLGADRRRLARRMIVESLLLFLAGALAGVPLAFWGTLGLSAFGPWYVAEAPRSGPHGGILLVSLGLGLATGVLCGLLPALSMTGQRLTESLKDARRFTGRWRGRGLRDLLVVGQVALTVVLIAGAGLLVRSFDRLQRVDPGIDPAGILTLDLQFPVVGEQARAEAYARVLDSVRGIPDVEAAALTDALPFRPSLQDPFRIEGRPAPPAGKPVFLICRFVSAGYFETLGIPLLRGRLFNGSDRLGAPFVAVISETMAARHWPGEDPIGKRFRTGYDDYDRPWLTVVGVVRDTRQKWLEEPFIETYRPLPQWPREAVSLLVRAPGDPRQWEGPLSRALRRADPSLASGSPESLEKIVDGYLAGNRFQSLLSLLFAVLALLLAAVGIYGVVSHSVARRTHEIGIRVALGAQPGDVLRRVILQGMAPVLAGLVLGLGAARLLGGLLADQLYEVRPGDPLTFTAAVVVIVGAGLVATYFPAHRATQVDPMAVLREE